MVNPSNMAVVVAVLAAAVVVVEEEVTIGMSSQVQVTTLVAEMAGVIAGVDMEMMAAVENEASTAMAESMVVGMVDMVENVAIMETVGKVVTATMVVVAVVVAVVVEAALVVATTEEDTLPLSSP